MNPTENRNSNLDLIRAIAIVLVLICHFGQHDLLGPVVSPKVVPFGLLGVDLFFVLSGYLVGSAYFKAERLPGFTPFSFWKIRWARTLPPYYAALILFSIFDFGKWIHAPGLKLGQFFFIQNYYENPPGFVVSWSLCIEEHFYLLLPFVGPFLKSLFGRLPKRIPVLILVLLSPTLFRLLHLKFGIPVGNYGDFKQTHLRYEGLLFGVLFAHVKARWDLERVLRYRGFLIAFGTLVLFSSIGLTRWLAPLGSAFGAAVLVCAAIPNDPLAGARNRIVYWFATRSYSMYLVHMAAFHFGIGHDWVRAAITFGMIVVGSEVFFRCVEKPALTLKERLKN